jgi:hypothetical protein
LEGEQQGRGESEDEESGGEASSSGCPECRQEDQVSRGVGERGMSATWKEHGRGVEV